MTRVATFSINATLTGGIQRAQQGVADAVKQQSTTKKANSYADLGTSAVRNIAAHGVVARLEAHSSVAKQVGTTLALYDANMTALDDSASGLRKSVLDAIGLGNGEALQSVIDGAFNQYRNALNADEGGQYMFAGSQTDKKPFVPQTLADMKTADKATAFVNDDVRASGSIRENESLTYGVNAREVGGSLFDAFQTLANLGSLGPKLTPDQTASLQKAVGQLDKGLADMRGVMAVNGRNQATVEDAETRAEARSNLMKTVVGETEDADLAQVATDLLRHRTILDISYKTFATISGLNLSQYLR